MPNAGEGERLKHQRGRNKGDKREYAKGILRSYPHHIPRFFQRLYPRRVWRVNTNSRKLYLSFDDGPTPGVTDRILDILGRYDAQATFFCTGRNVERAPQWLDRFRDAGHGIGNHGYDHRYGRYCDDPIYLADVEYASRFIPSSLFRPPYGRLTHKQARSLERRYRIVMWDVLSGDFDPRSSGSYCAEKVLRYGKSGSILLFHDSEKAKERVLEALPKVLEHFRGNGYVFDPIPGSQVGIQEGDAASQSSQ